MAPAARAGTDQGSETVCQDSGDDDDPAGGPGQAPDSDRGTATAITFPSDLVSPGYRVAGAEGAAAPVPTGSTPAEPAAGILGPGGTNLHTAARVLGMELTTLQEELRSGATLGDLARLHDVEQVALVRALAQEQESRLERWLQQV
ncbi:hypothetical protein [Ornithinicoccus hortensis]|uniref:hypothetical protein n=1 Tax=Ornithinicoccus hortensis TaxID=82346 RepID=UPI001154D9CB|nr:hypothetical protein [Ornithinicoccus hortensis]